MHTNGTYLADPKDTVTAGVFELITSILTPQRVACHIHMSTSDFSISFPLGSILGNKTTLDPICSQSRLTSTLNEKIMPWEVDEVCSDLAWRLRYSSKIITFNSIPMVTQANQLVTDWDFEDSDMLIKWRDGDFGEGINLFVNGLFNKKIKMQEVNADVVFKNSVHIGELPDNHYRVLRKLNMLIRQHREALEAQSLEDMKSFAKEALDVIDKTGINTGLNTNNLAAA